MDKGPVPQHRATILPNCHGASCMQANGAEGRKDDRLKEKERERRKDPTGVDTVIYSKKGGLLPKS